jgi:hypothetical protein
MREIPAMHRRTGARETLRSAPVHAGARGRTSEELVKKYWDSIDIIEGMS